MVGRLEGVLGFVLHIVAFFVYLIIFNVSLLLPLCMLPCQKCHTGYACTAAVRASVAACRALRSSVFAIQPSMLRLPVIGITTVQESCQSVCLSGHACLQCASSTARLYASIISTHQSAA